MSVQYPKTVLFLQKFQESKHIEEFNKRHKCFGQSCSEYCKINFEGIAAIEILLKFTGNKKIFLLFKYV